MHRHIAGFHQDDQGDWVAELDCLHSQHIRHQPPFRNRSWVTTEAGRAERLGSELDCPLCDRAEVPQGLSVTQTLGPIEHTSLPLAQASGDCMPAGTWGLLRVIDGSLELVIDTTPAIQRRLEAGDEQPLPPEVPHRLGGGRSVRLEIDLLTRHGPGGVGSGTA